MQRAANALGGVEPCTTQGGTRETHGAATRNATEIAAADVAEIAAPADVTTAGATCAVSEPFAFQGGGTTWTVILDDNGVGGTPASR